MKGQCDGTQDCHVVLGSNLVLVCIYTQKYSSWRALKWRCVFLVRQRYKPPFNCTPEITSEQAIWLWNSCPRKAINLYCLETFEIGLDTLWCSAQIKAMCFKGAKHSRLPQGKNHPLGAGDWMQIVHFHLQFLQVCCMLDSETWNTVICCRVQWHNLNFFCLKFN